MWADWFCVRTVNRLLKLLKFNLNFDNEFVNNLRTRTVLWRPWTDFLVEVSSWRITAMYVFADYRKYNFPSHHVKKKLSTLCKIIFLFTQSVKIFILFTASNWFGFSFRKHRLSCPHPRRKYFTRELQFYRDLWCNVGVTLLDTPEFPKKFRILENGFKGYRVNRRRLRSATLTREKTPLSDFLCPPAYICCT